MPHHPNVLQVITCGFHLAVPSLHDHWGKHSYGMNWHGLLAAVGEELGHLTSLHWPGPPAGWPV